MSIGKDRAYEEVLRQLSTAELLDRYYKQTPELTGKDRPKQLADGVMINDVQMSVKDARDYLIMQLVKQSHSVGR